MGALNVSLNISVIQVLGVVFITIQRGKNGSVCAIVKQLWAWLVTISNPAVGRRFHKRFNKIRGTLLNNVTG